MGFISLTKLQALLDSLDEKSSMPVTLIDVRSGAEILSSGAIPGSINIPIAKISQVMLNMDETRFKNVYGREKPKKETENVVLTCRSGARARAAERILNKVGYKKLRVYEGSFLDWKANNGPLVFE